ncbi:MAG: hypothetical protein U0074_01015 [Kouleothrix sp.]
MPIRLPEEALLGSSSNRTKRVLAPCRMHHQLVMAQRGHVGTPHNAIQLCCAGPAASGRAHSPDQHDQRGRGPHSARIERSMQRGHHLGIRENS